MRPTECKWCGCGSVYSVSDRHVKFTCRSAWTADGDCWACSSQCCDGMRDRIQRAVEVLERARRICVVMSDGNDDPIESEHDGVIYVESTEADRAAAILRGNSPESPDSSPITTDDLAASDYYEAVRQRVPWMVAVEHIEGLVEGYRRCGVMVWQTAEEIRKVHGGEYEQAD